MQSISEQIWTVTGWLKQFADLTNKYNNNPYIYQFNQQFM